MKNYNKLDVSAKLFPSISNKRNSSVFRLSVILKNKIDPYYLQLAINIIYERYSLFFLKLKKGLFWNYLEKNKFHFKIEEEKETPCSHISSNENNGYIIKVLYYQNRISIEAFHSITDGSGILEMLKSLVYYYICSKDNIMIKHENKILLCNEKKKNDNDSFIEYNKSNIKKKYTSIKQKNSYLINGKKFKYGNNVITGIVPVTSLKNICKSKDCTITAFLTSIMIQSVFLTKKKNNNLPIVIAVPINLRKIFPSKTLKNFFGIINIGYKINSNTKFDDLLKSVNNQLKLATNKEYLEEQVNQNVKLSKNVFSTFTPLIIKNILLPIGFNYFGEIKKTLTISNVGIFDFPSGINKYVAYSETVLYPTKKSPINCGICSHKDNLSISFTRSIVDVNIIKTFFITLTKTYNLSVSIYSNNWSDKNEKM